MKYLFKKLNVIRLEEGDKVIVNGIYGVVVEVHENYFLPIVSSYEILLSTGEKVYEARSEIKLIK